MKIGLTTSIQHLKENESVAQKFNVATAIKEKYFEMWQASEKEKDKLKTSKYILNASLQNIATGM